MAIDAPSSDGNRATGDWSGWLEAAQRGDGKAYRRFLIEAVPFLRAVVRRQIYANDLVEDVVQDALMTIHRVRHTYEPGRPVKPWLAAIANRRAIDTVRKSSRLAAREGSSPAAYETFSDPGTNGFEAGENARAVERLIDRLPPRQKEAVKLTKLAEMSLAEAAAASGQSVASIKVNVHRAIRRLRIEFGKEGSE